MTHISYTINTIDVDVGDPDLESNIPLAHLLVNEVVFINSHWWEKSWPEKAQDSVGVFVVCNDTFNYACADSEDLPYHCIMDLYKMWRKSPLGPIVWCMMRRGYMPLPEVAQYIRNEGIWDLDSLNLKTNPHDKSGEVGPSTQA